MWLLTIAHYRGTSPGTRILCEPPQATCWPLPRGNDAVVICLFDSSAPPASGYLKPYLRPSRTDAVCQRCRFHSRRDRFGNRESARTAVANVRTPGDGLLLCLNSPKLHYLFWLIDRSSFFLRVSHFTSSVLSLPGENPLVRLCETSYASWTDCTLTTMLRCPGEWTDS